VDLKCIALVINLLGTTCSLQNLVGYFLKGDQIMFKYLLIVIISFVFVNSDDVAAQESQPVTIEQHERLIRALRVLNGKIKASEELSNKQAGQIELLEKEIQQQAEDLKTPAVELPVEDVSQESEPKQNELKQFNYNIYSIILIILLTTVTVMLTYSFRKLREKVNETDSHLREVELKEAELDAAVKQSVSALEQEKIASVEKLQLQLANASKLLSEQFESATKSLSDQGRTTKSKAKSNAASKDSAKDDPNQLNMFDSLFE